MDGTEVNFHKINTTAMCRNYSTCKEIRDKSAVTYGCELYHKEGWVPKNWCFWSVVLEKTLESPFDCKIKPVHPQGNQSWIFTGRTDAEAETPILWPPDSRADSLEKIWCWERLKAEGKGDNRGLDGWMASPTQWIWVWVNSGRWWRTVKSEELQSMRSQKAGHSLATEQQEINQVSTKWTWEEGSNSYEQEEIRIEHVGEVRNVKGWTVLRSWKCRGGTRVAVTSKCTFEVQRRHSGVCE